MTKLLDESTMVRTRPVRDLEQAPSRLLNRNYLLLMNGQLISRMGTSLSALVMILWIKQVTESASLMGLFNLVTAIPGIVLGVIGGTVSDRYSRRKIIAYSDALSGLAMLGLALMFFFFPDRISLLMVSLAVVSIFASSADSFSTPAITAALPDLVPRVHLTRANSISQLTLQIAMFLGQIVAGYAFRVLGVFAVCLLNGITYLTAGLTESFVRIPQHIPAAGVTWRDTLQGFRHDIREGFSLIWKTQGLRALVLISSLMSFVLAAVLVVIPFYVSEQLQQREDWVGFLSAAYGIGSLVGYLAASLRELQGVTRAAFVVVAMFLQSLITLALGVVSSAPVALTVVFVGGVFGGFSSIYVMTIVQSTTPSEVRGRVFGFLGAIAASLAPLGMGVGGFVFDWIGQSIPLMYLGCGTLMVVLVILLSSNRHVRAFLATDTTLPFATSPPPSFHAEGL